MPDISCENYQVQKSIVNILMPPKKVEGSAFLEDTEEGLQAESAKSFKAYQRNPIEESTPALEVQTSLSVPVVTMTSSESVAESLYFTPETSVTEKLSEFAGEDE